MPSGSTPRRESADSTASPYDELPDGAFVMHDGVPKLVHDAMLRTWSTGGYGASVAPPSVAGRRS